MPLSNDLISQFVKITKDETKTKPETSVYGTVVEQGESTFVRLDGSDLVTPVSKTADAKDGDRVTVMIKNHSAIITGNLSSPAARVADLIKAGADIEAFEVLLAGTATVGQLDAVEARVDTLEANSLTADQIEAVETVTKTLEAGIITTEEFNAVEADVNNLRANMLTVQNGDLRYALIDDLDAAEASIDTLSSDLANFKTATATNLNAVDASIQNLSNVYAKITDLNAAKGRITSLESDVANIDTLIFGSATGTTIQTNFSNSVIAQLGDAQIKSAMIDSISASKIMAGDIITNNVRVKSSDGRLVISDETMQISDANRVRVQIGKDASNDYSINIWDASGNLMFSKGGITDSAIKSAIIRNDMVSETANISASKLDIDSLFEEINDSTNTIKSTRVYLDDNKQTLDVAFKSLSSTVTSQGQTISSQGTAISTIQGQITSKVWQQDINTAKDEMSTQYSALSQDLSGFKTTVGNTYATNTRVASAEASITQLSNEVTINVAETTNLGTRMTTVEQTADGLTARLDDMHIGGRNLLRNSRLIQLLSNNSNVYPTSCTLTTENGVTFYRVKRINTETYPDTTLSVFSTIPKTSFEYGEMTGKQVTLSFKARASHEITATFMDYTYGGDAVVDFGKKGETITTEWKTYHVVIDSFPDMTNRTGVRWNPYKMALPSDILADFYIDVCDYKFELGNQPTDWSPAPEDIDADISELGEQVVEAGKTATDYLNLSSAGLVVGQNPSNPTAGNTLISADGVTIRKGTTILAAFKAASRTVSGISSATLTSKDLSDSESDGVTSVSGTVNKNESRSTIYITTNGNPVYFPEGLETAKVLINDSSGIIANCNMLLAGSLVDETGEGIFTPVNSYGNTIIGYGRYQDGGATHVYGTRVKAKTKTGFSASVNGVAALDTNNSEGNATFGWHHYEANSGETNIYGYIASLFAKDTIRLNPNGNTVLMNGNLIPYDTNKYNLGSTASPFKNIYLSSENTGSYHGIRTTNGTSSYNVLGVNEGGYVVFGNTTYCTNLVGRSTTTSSTGYSFKITCGDNPGLVLGDNDARLFLFGGTDGTSRYIGSVAAYKRTYTAASNMVITDNSIIGRATSSSERYKKDIVELDAGEVSALYDMPVFKFKYKDDYIASTDERYGVDIPGFIAEKVAEFFPVACDHKVDSNGNRIPEMWNSQIIIPALLKLIQDLNRRMKFLEEKGE